MTEDMNGNRQKRGVGSGAFTLVKLLVVISIIVLLIALLLPSLHKPKQVGQPAPEPVVDRATQFTG